jgi:hypothetical protein
LSRIIHEARRDRNIKGIGDGGSNQLTHLLFVDDVLLFHDGIKVDGRKFRDIL